MCLKRSPKYYWNIEIKVIDNSELDKIDKLQSQLKISNNLYYATVKRLNEFCFYIFNNCSSVNCITAHNIVEEGQPTITIRLMKEE